MNHFRGVCSRSANEASRCPFFKTQSMSSLSFELASERDDADLRRLLRENPMPGSISLSFEREPCYFDVSIVEGEFHQTIVARESDTGTVIALGNRSVRPLFVNGRVQDIGYMS